MKQFEVGKTYSMTSICNHECVWTYTVVARTAHTVTLSDGEKVITRRVAKNPSAWCGRECVYPLGTYSLAPVLRA